MMNKYEYGNMNDPGVYLDENNRRMMTNIRNSFNRLASGLIDEGKQDSAITVLDRCFELVPGSLVPYEFFSLELIENYYRAGAEEKGKRIMEEAYTMFEDELSYFLSLNRKFLQTPGINQEIQRNLFFLQRMERVASNYGDAGLSQLIGNSVQKYIEMYNTL